MLGRRLDSSFAGEVRANLTAVTAGRLTANAAYRYSGPFLGSISRGLNVTLGQIGVAVAIAELSGLLGPFVGRTVDRVQPRRAMWIGLVGVAGGAIVAATAAGLVQFALGLLLLGVAKSGYDIALGTWVAQHTPYETRSRVVGLTETSWALGLLVGVSVMGVVTGLADFRVAYVVIAVAVVMMAATLRRRLPEDHLVTSTGAPAAIGRIDGRGLLAVIGMLALAGAAQALFVTFGSWLEDAHGFTSVGLAAVTFALGAAELMASLTSAARTDRWGKERSVIAGAVVMVPATVVVVLGQHSLGLGLAAVVVAIVMFEFAIVSAIALASTLVPGSPARGLAWIVAATTVGRAVVAIPATRLYDKVGIDGPAMICAGLAAVAAVCFAGRLRVGAAQR